MKYRAVWYDENGDIVSGVFTSNLETAKGEAEFKRALGFFAWTENDENERVD